VKKIKTIKDLVAELDNDIQGSNKAIERALICEDYEEVVAEQATCRVLEYVKALALNKLD
jgi:hypothetical protein